LENIDERQFAILESMLKKTYGKDSKLAKEISDLFKINEELNYLIGQIESKII
jgi:hypothetical protein